MSEIRLDNVLDTILSYSEENSDEVNKFKLDMLNKKVVLLSMKV